MNDYQQLLRCLLDGRKDGTLSFEAEDELLDQMDFAWAALTDSECEQIEAGFPG